MRYYKHNINRSFDAKFYNGRRSFKKLMYMLDSNRTRLLDSGYFESQTWGALHKAWKGYVIAKNKYEFELMEYYASVIQNAFDDNLSKYLSSKCIKHYEHSF
jgi:hypothetical protein